MCVVTDWPLAVVSNTRLRLNDPPAPPANRLAGAAFPGTESASQRFDTEKPDEWRIDLDPMPHCDFATVRRVAHVAHEVLDELGAVGWPKTSGGRGMHIYVRIPPRWGFQDVRRGALAFAKEVERRSGGDVTTAWWRKDREPDALFVDYNQNARDHTIASAYSAGIHFSEIIAPWLKW